MEPIVATRVIEPSLSPASRAWRIPIGIFAAGGIFGALAALAFCRHTGTTERVLVRSACSAQHVVIHREIAPAPVYQYLMFNGPDLRVRVWK